MFQGYEIVNRIDIVSDDKNAWYRNLALHPNTRKGLKHL